MERITRVINGTETYALFVRGTVETQAAKFLTEPTDPLQAGVMERPKGFVVQPHSHPYTERRIAQTSEFLHIQKGKIAVTVFDDDWKQLAQETFEAGDFLIFFRGGHQVEMLEDTRMIEVKQGPYIGDAASKSFRPSA